MKRIYLIGLLLSLITVFTTTSMAQNAKYEADGKTIESVCDGLLETISVEKGDKVDWDRFDYLVLPEIQFIVCDNKKGKAQSMVLDSEKFKKVAPYGKIGFKEVALHRKINQYGNIAHVFEAYSAYVTGEKEEMRGINAYTVVFKEDRWWIANITWMEETPNNPLPAYFLSEDWEETGSEINGRIADATTNTGIGDMSDEYLSEIQIFQQELNDSYKNPEESPLPEDEIEQFEGLPFYDINPKYQVEARFVKTPKEAPFKMKTTTDRTPLYKKYGELMFELEGESIKLNVYQSLDLVKMPEYADYLFLPFTDNTSGGQSYGGGRFIDITIPEGETMIVDFNKAYNPYCAYSDKFSCPIPPKENHIDLEIKAGVQFQN